MVANIKREKSSKDLVEELYNIPDNGKAEIVNGKIVRMSPTGSAPNRAAGRIYIRLDHYVRLDQYERDTGRGYAFTDNAGFLVDLPRRGSFSPDAAFFVGELTGPQFLQGAPVFAVEVRSENDYGPAAERRIRDKINDYFAAGTKVVWDVDVLQEKVIRSYRADSPDRPKVFRRGEHADAEPALPGFTMPVDEIF
jgi:Uma2 family endonuclease